MTLRHSLPRGLLLLSLLAWSIPAAASAKLDPRTLITPQEAETLLGAPATLEVHDMQAVYPGSADFTYQTRNIHILSAAFYPTNGTEMFENQRKNLSAAGKKLLPCAVADACFLVGGQLNARKGNVYFTMEGAGRGDVPKIEILARKVVGRLP